MIDIGNPTERMLKFLEPSGTAIETLTPTAWAGHIPFMFCLMNYVRPRTYVELGTHYGASFFAACQAIREFRIDCTPTAIDLWEGDEHAGKYDEEVFKQFKWILGSKYAGISNIVRKDFTEAAADFKDKSLDLIHIDGLHTYEAVKNDYEIWLPKASANGVVLFHDTQVLERGFGVWRLWNEIKDDHVSFNFTHTHGLGIIALGSRATNPLISILELVNSSEPSKNAFDNFFHIAGKQALSEAMSKIRLGELQAIYDRIPPAIINLLRNFRRVIRG